MQPRQIYASTVTRRDRRLTRRRTRGLRSPALVSFFMLLAVLSAVAALAPALS